jgi:hypothetical protein
VRESPPFGTTTMSPTRIKCLAFAATTPLRIIAPEAQRLEAVDRLLAKRANHSH